MKQLRKSRTIRTRTTPPQRTQEAIYRLVGSSVEQQHGQGAGNGRGRGETTTLKSVPPFWNAYMEFVDELKAEPKLKMPFYPRQDKGDEIPYTLSYTAGKTGNGLLPY